MCKVGQFPCDRLHHGQQHCVQAVAQHPRVRAAAPYVQAQGMLSYDGQVRGVMVRGILPEAEDKVADFRSYMKSGKLDSLRDGEFGMVLGSAVRMAAVGITIGGASALAATRALKGLLFGVTAADPTTFFVVSLTVLVVAVVASGVPAWRATRVDPIVALRRE